MENSILWSVRHERLHQLFDDFPEIERLARIINERYYICLEERLISGQLGLLGALRTDDRRNLTFIKRVTLGHIASYLGISQETLSRIRAKI